MLILEANTDGTITVALSNDSEIEITIIELKRGKPQITIRSDEPVSVVKYCESIDHLATIS